MLPHKNLVFCPLSRLFNISQLSEMHFKMISDEFWKIYIAFMPDMDNVFNRNWVSGASQMRWNYLKKSKPVNYGNILQPDRNKDATDPRNRVHGKNHNRLY